MKKTLLVLTLIWSLWVYNTLNDNTHRFTVYFAKNPVVNQSVVNIRGLWSGCTGFIGKQNYIVTAGHCAEFDLIYTITFYDGRQVPAMRVYSDMVEDYAILRTPTYNYPPVKFAEMAPLELGDPVYHIRYMLEDEFGQLKSMGVFATTQCNPVIPEYNGCLHFVAIITVPGDSGGPLFRMDSNEVIGIMSMGYWPLGSPMSMFVPIENVVDRLEELAEREY